MLQTLVGRAFQTMFKPFPPQLGAAVMQVRPMQSTGVLTAVRFRVRSGALMGVEGMVGEGRRAVLARMLGLARLARGAVMLAGEKVQLA